MRFSLFLLIVFFNFYISKSQSTFVFSGYTAGQTWTTNSYAYTNTQNGTTMTTKISQSSTPGWFNLTGAMSPNYAAYSPSSCGSITGLYLVTDRASTSPTVTVDMSFSPSVCGPVTFTITDINGGDNSFRDDVKITAYDQQGVQIALTTAMVNRNGATSCTSGFLGAGYLTATSGSLQISGCSYDNCNAVYFTISSATKMISRIVIDYGSGNRDWSGNTISNPTTQYIMLGNIKAYTPVVNITPSCVSNPITLTGSIGGGGFPPTTNPSSPYPAVVSLPTAPTYAWTGTAGTITSPTALATTVSGLTPAGGTYTLTAQNNKGCVATNTISVSSVNCTVLPIELLSFSAKREADDVKVTWLAAADYIKSNYIVEHSIDGIVFTELAKVEPNENTSRIMSYNVVDYKPGNQAMYYRLKQIDDLGLFKYSNIIRVEADFAKTYMSNIYPNPTTSNVDFDFYTPVKGELNYDITDLTGRILVAKKEWIEEGSSKITTIVNELPNGIYFLKVNFDKANFVSVNKMVKH